MGSGPGWPCSAQWASWRKRNGLPSRPSADRYRGAARLGEHPDHVVQGPEVAVANDRDRSHGVDHRLDPVPVHFTLEPLVAGPAVNDDRSSPDALERPGQPWGRERGVVPAEPHLDRHRHRDRLDHRGYQRLGGVDLIHQGRSAAGPNDFIDRAAHIDVDYRRAVVDHPTRRAGHLVNDVTVKLDRQGSVVVAGFG